MQAWCYHAGMADEEAFEIRLTSEEVTNIMTALEGYASSLLDGLSAGEYGPLQASAAKYRKVRDAICIRAAKAKVDAMEAEARIRERMAREAAQS